MDGYELFNSYLEWNGIYGYTDEILVMAKSSRVTRTNYYKDL